MDFSLSKQDQLFLQMIREFAEKEVKPLAAEVDESERFPMETVQKWQNLVLWVSHSRLNTAVPVVTTSFTRWR